MGDRGHNRHGSKRGGATVPLSRTAGTLFRGAGYLSNNVAWAEAYLHKKWHLDACSRLSTIEMGRKLGGDSAPFLRRGLGPHLTQSRLGWGLPPYQVASWSIQPFGHNRYGPKIGGSAPFWGRGAGSPPNTMWQGRGLPACQHSSWSIQPFGHNTPTSQTDRTDNGLIA